MIVKNQNPKLFKYILIEDIFGVELLKTAFS